MKITKSEKEVVEDFKRRIEEKYPGKITEVLVFGSKAKGNATEDSDIDILVIIYTENKQVVKEIRNIGYDLEIENDFILSIQVFSEKYINYLRSIPTQFIQNVDSVAISI